MAQNQIKDAVKAAKETAVDVFRGGGTLGVALP